MKKTLLLVISIILICPLSSIATEREALLKQLDEIINSRHVYASIKENRIDSLKQLVSIVSGSDRLYQINKEIFEEYSTYRYDSAMYYVCHNKDIAHALNITKYKDEITLQTVTLLATTGMIKESFDLLNHISRPKIDTSLLLYYHKTVQWAYYAAKNYAEDDKFAPHYSLVERLYLDSIYQVSPQNSQTKKYYEGYTMLRDGELEEAEKILSDILETLPVDTREYAITANNLATISELNQEWDMFEKYLIKASISDQVCCLKENVAMQRLAIYLFQNKPEDLDRAYIYIQCAMEDAQFFNSRFRTIQIAKNLPVIVSAYNYKNESKNRTLKILLNTVSILSFLMIILIFSIYRQINLLKKKRKELSWLNTQLQDLNNELTEANKTREEYVGLFMDLCSSYIEKLGQYMETVKRKIIAKQIDELLKLSNSPKTIQKELDNFLINFDNAFLNLYPTFVDDFNKLLSEEGKIYPKKKEKMNTELRIFALIRLGISDSSKIAAFLRYSPQTIYNYRTKVKNFAIVDRNVFEKYILQIGSFEKDKMKNTANF